MTAVALVACSAAGAEPGAPASGGAGTPPAGWKQLPAVATAAGASARASGVAVDAVDAWGEPARGCYAVWLTLHGGAADAPALADQVIDSVKAWRDARQPAPRPVGRPSGRSLGRPSGSIGTERGKDAGNPRDEGVTLDEIVKPGTPEGVLAFAFARPPYRGRVRAHLGNGRITAIACFGDQREPAACDAVCTRVLQGVP